MEDIMITSGTSFEGYEISEYGPYRFVQTILSSNFLKEIGSSIADIATDRSSIYQEKQSSHSRRWLARPSTMQL